MALTFGMHISHMGGRSTKCANSGRSPTQWGSTDSQSPTTSRSRGRGGKIDCYEGIAIMTTAAVETWARARHAEGHDACAFRDAAARA